MCQSGYKIIAEPFVFLLESDVANKSDFVVFVFNVYIRKVNFNGDFFVFFVIYYAKISEGFFVVFNLFILFVYDKLIKVFAFKRASFAAEKLFCL